MSKTRLIRPTKFIDDSWAALSLPARLLDLALPTLADREGRLPDKPKVIWAQIFPHDPSIDVASLLAELSAAGLVRRYTAEGKQCIDLPAFKVEQTPHGSEKQSELPPFCGPMPENAGVLRESLARIDTCIDTCIESEIESETKEIPELANASPEAFALKDSPKRTLATQKTASEAADVDAVNQHWRQRHPRAAKSLKASSKEYKAIAARLAEGFTVADLQAACDGAHLSPFHCGQNDKGANYLSLLVIFRDASQVTKFIETADNPPRPGLSEKTRQTIDGAAQYRASKGVANVR